MTKSLADCASNRTCRMSPMASLLVILLSGWVVGGSMVAVRYHKILHEDRKFKDGLLFESPAVSIVECAAMCNRWPSDCVTFTFQLKTCRGHAVSVKSDAPFTSAVGALSFAQDPEPVSGCAESDAPPSNGSVTWSLTMTSLQGVVTCYPGFFNTTSLVLVECTEGGSWQAYGRCLQHLWTAPPWPLYPEPLPVPMDEGWTVCVEGYPTAATRLTMSLKTETGVSLQVTVRLGQNTSIALSAKSADVWGSKAIITQCPAFAVDKLFHMAIKVTGNGTYEVYVSSVLCTTFEQRPETPASDVTSFNIKYDVKVTSLDFLCSL